MSRLALKYGLELAQRQMSRPKYRRIKGSNRSSAYFVHVCLRESRPWYSAYVDQVEASKCWLLYATRRVKSYARYDIDAMT